MGQRKRRGPNFEARIDHLISASLSTGIDLHKFDTRQRTDRHGHQYVRVSLPARSRNKTPWSIYTLHRYYVDVAARAELMALQIFAQQSKRNQSRDTLRMQRWCARRSAR